VTENKIKVLFVLNTLGLGGAEVQISRTAPYFDPRISVEVAYYDESVKELPKAMLENTGISVHFLDRARWGRLLYFHKAAKFMRGRRYDIVHAWTGTANLYGRVPAVWAGVPVVIGGLLGRRTANGILGTIYSLTNFRCAAWIVNARDIKRIAEKKLKFIRNTPIYVIPNGIPVGEMSIFAGDKQTEYDKLRSDRLIIGTVGRMTPVKNHRMFVEMAKLVLQRGIKADFWLIGDGPLQNEITHLVKRHGLEKYIKLLGQRTDVDAALARMDVFCLTSDSEGCPNTLLEALRAGLPVVSTNCSSLEEIVEVNGNGFLVEVGDAETMARSVVSLLEDKQMRKRMSQRSKEIVNERFRMEIAARRLERVYFSCLFRASRTQPELREKLTCLGIEDPGECAELL